MSGEGVHSAARAGEQASEPWVQLGLSVARVIEKVLNALNQVTSLAIHGKPKYS